MNRRWRCPQCGDGINAPSRLRRLDVRRFCLRCSAAFATGLMVERVCLAREREKASTRARAKARLERAREREAQRDAASLPAQLVAASPWCDATCRADVWERRGRLGCDRHHVEVQGTRRRNLYIAGRQIFGAKWVFGVRFMPTVAGAFEALAVALDRFYEQQPPRPHLGFPTP